jgi:hypothetical protein
MRLRDVRSTLVAQHTDLRRLIASVEEALDRGLPAGEVGQRLEALRRAVEAHNATEEGTLTPVLEVIDAWGPQRVDALVREHHAEHEEVLAGFEPGRVTDVSHVRHLLAALLAHMAQEEKTLLSEKLLRDDVIQLDAGD